MAKFVKVVVVMDFAKPLVIAEVPAPEPGEAIFVGMEQDGIDGRVVLKL